MSTSWGWLDEEMILRRHLLPKGDQRLPPEQGRDGWCWAALHGHDVAARSGGFPIQFIGR